MNDWYNTNEHRSYPFIENLSPSEPLPEKEIVDCKFFLLNADNPKVWLYSREKDGNTITYTFKTENLDMVFEVPVDEEYKVIWKHEKEWYGFVVFGDTTN